MSNGEQLTCRLAIRFACHQIFVGYFVRKIFEFTLVHTHEALGHCTAVPCRTLQHIEVYDIQPNSVGLD